MMSMNSKQPFSVHTHGVHPILAHEPKYTPLHPGSEAIRRACLPTPSLQGNIFAGFDESLLQRAEALAAVDIAPLSQKPHPFKPDATYHTMTTPTSSAATHLHHPSVLQAVSHHAHHAAHHQAHHHHHHHPGSSGGHHHGGGGGALDGSGPLGSSSDLLDHLSGLAGGLAAPGDAHMAYHHHHHHHQQAMNMHPHALSAHASLGGSGAPPGGMGGSGESEPDPRELESFAERFKQRRIKLGVTQADVGSALANLKIPGVGCLSQSTICRFESLTLSHNNMVALKPILEAWLEEAERAQREKMAKPEVFAGGDKKRKRTSIAAPEKRSLEAYFGVQPRPSSEKIAAIAEKLDLKKNVVRVWFCNQRQKQKRMKFSATH